MRWLRMVSAAYKIAKWGRYREKNRMTLREKSVAYRRRRLETEAAKLGHGDKTRIYYVYELYTILSSGEHYTYYYGKGKGDRVYQHERAYRRKLKNPRSLLDPKEKMMLFFEDHGMTLYNRIIQSGMTEDEAFNLEAEMINGRGLQNLTNVAYPRRPRVLY